MAQRWCRASQIATAFLLVVAVAGCSEPSRDVTASNRTGMTIRLTGNCVADDPHILKPGEEDRYLYFGADCRVDNGDGSHRGILGCVTLRTHQTDITMASLAPITGPNDCWGAGDR